MDPQEKRMLHQILELTEDNHKKIKKLYRAMQVGRVMKTIYWVIILGVAIGAFYFLQPYIDNLIETYNYILNETGFLESGEAQVSQ